MLASCEGESGDLSGEADVEGCNLDCTLWYALCGMPSSPAWCIPESRIRPRQGVCTSFHFTSFSGEADGSYCAGA